eukprot:4027908-Pleurochrysis_carterae.AAC.1
MACVAVPESQSLWASWLPLLVPLSSWQFDFPGLTHLLFILRTHGHSAYLWIRGLASPGAAAASAARPFHPGQSRKIVSRSHCRRV